ncbi:MAG: DNA mismatch repair protein MutS [Flavobacteriales bacterium]|nr:DNA mismatch repair protein MutS [Flavobacteriales bacterium]
MENNPKDFYRNRISNLSTELVAVKRKALALAMLRLAVFLGMGLGLYFLSHSNLAIVLILVVGITSFLLLVSRSVNARLHKRFLEERISINEKELRIFEGDLSDLDTGTEFIGEEHHFNQDIDLFGQGSVFQIINRTPLKTARKRLADLLNSNSIDQIREKQEAIQELAQKAEWRQDFDATAALIDQQIESSVISSWVQNYKAVIPNLFRFFPIIFFVCSMTLLGLYAFSIIGGHYVLLQFFLGATITGIYFKRISKLYHTASKTKDTLSQFSKLLQFIENTDFESEILQKEKKRIEEGDKKASAILAGLSREINSLDQRNNILFTPFANGFALWDLRFSWRIERWIKSFETTVENWFDAIDNFHAYNSLANYAFNHPAHIYPEISDADGALIEATQMGHPLLSPQNRIDNDFSIKREEFFIVTGANMAGKSTFLRTIGVNIVLANNGLPICAQHFIYKPIKLISSMRTTDSLMKDESYFFSELKRLKFIVEEIKTDEYFIILDEILKGTNSVDKEKGSKKFVQKLLESDSTGIIATHDLSLCQLEEENKEIFNYYFDAEIKNDELHFDYRLKEGVCQNMNASFLLKKMEIV